MTSYGDVTMTQADSVTWAAMTYYCVVADDRSTFAFLLLLFRREARDESKWLHSSAVLLAESVANRCDDSSGPVEHVDTDLPDGVMTFYLSSLYTCRST